MNRNLTLIIACMLTLGAIAAFTLVQIPWQVQSQHTGHAQPVRLLPVAEAKEEASSSEGHDQESDIHANEQEVSPKDSRADAEEASEGSALRTDDGQESLEQTVSEENELTPREVEKKSAENDEQKPPSQEREEIPEAAFEEQLQKTQTRYQDIQQVTKAPQFPLDQLRKRIVYPPLAKRQGKEGIVLLDLYLSAEGTVEQITVIDDPGYGMGEAARKAFQGMQAQPAEQDGMPVAVKMRYPVRFTLQGK